MKKTAARAAARTGTPTLLSGGNPQVGKGDGHAPVEVYIAAMPGWKRAVGRRLDTLIVRTVPGVKKAVKWNSPFYGVEGRGWFLAFHCFTKYIKVTFFRGAALRPLPPVASKDPNTRYVHIEETDDVDEGQLATWIRQAAALPGWIIETAAPRQTAAKRASRKAAAPASAASRDVSRKIDRRIRELGDWRGRTLSLVRQLIREADPEVVEEWKWQKASSPGTPVWSHDGGLCTGEVYKHVVKLTFFHGASLEDPRHLFNASLDGTMRRAIDIREGDQIDEPAFRALVRAAMAFNAATRKK